MYSIGYDIGSSSVKAALVNMDTGNVIASVRYPDKELDIQSPHPGWAEQDPDYWWECVRIATKKLIEENQIDSKLIKCVGIAYQMHGLVVVNEAGEVLRPSIIWCDSRAVDTGEWAADKMDQDQAFSSLLNLPGNFTSSKLRWVKENEPEVYQQIYKILLPGDFIAMRLSGNCRTTITGLSEGVLWDFKNQRVSQQVLDVYELDENVIPDVSPIIGVQDLVGSQGAEETGLPEGIPISYRAGDQPNNAFSLGVFKPGEVAASGGTSGVVYGVTDKLIYDNESRVNSFAHVNHSPEDPHIGVLMCVNGTGIQYNWLRQLLGPSQSYNELEEEAGQSPIGAEGLLSLPFGNGAERILGNQNVGAMMSQIDFNRHGKSHLLRSGLEGIAFSFVYGIGILKSLGLEIDVIRAGDDNLFQSQIFSETIATLCDCEIDIMHTTGAVGAAAAAIIGAGYWSGPEILLDNLKKVKSYFPNTDKQLYQQAYENWHKLLVNQL